MIQSIGGSHVLEHTEVRITRWFLGHDSSFNLLRLIEIVAATKLNVKWGHFSR